MEIWVLCGQDIEPVMLDSNWDVHVCSCRCCYIKILLAEMISCKSLMVEWVVMNGATPPPVTRSLSFRVQCSLEDLRCCCCCVMGRTNV